MIQLWSPQKYLSTSYCLNNHNEIHQRELNDFHTQQIPKTDVVGAVWEHLEELVVQQQLKHMGIDKYNAVFKPIPHVDELPTDVYCWIHLKDTSKTIAMWSYSSPWKYHEAWCTLLQHHKDAGQIHPSNLSLASPLFLVPKVDPTVLLCWVNNYWVLNTNTVLDSYPLPYMDDILADCAKGWIWSWLDMMNLFFKPEYTLMTSISLQLPHPLGSMTGQW